MMPEMFRFAPAEDEQTDDEYVLLEDENWTVQVCPYAGGFAVNEHGQTDPNDPETFFVRGHGIYPKRATAFAVCLAKARAAKKAVTA